MVVQVVKGYFLILLVLLRKEAVAVEAVTMVLGLEAQGERAVVAHLQVAVVE